MTVENKLFLEVVENHFSVHVNSDSIELETWTDGGVNMFVVIHKDVKEPYFTQFKEYVLSFDTDEEIDMHRQDNQYKNDFTIRESLEDFEAYKERLEGILEELEG